MEAVMSNPWDEDTEEDLRAREELERNMPSKEELREFAKKHPPPPEYFEGDEEMPSIPIDE
jgi:hypothetical protein